MRLAVVAVASLLSPGGLLPLLVLSLFDLLFMIVAAGGVLAGLAIRWLWFHRHEAARSIRRPATAASATTAPRSARAAAWPTLSTPTTAPNPSMGRGWTPKIIGAVVALFLLAAYFLASEGNRFQVDPPSLTLAPRYEGTAILEGQEWMVTERISFSPTLLEQLNERVKLDTRRAASLVHDLVSPSDFSVQETNGNLVVTPIGRQSQSKLDATTDRIRSVLRGQGWLVQQQQQNILVTPTGVVSSQEVLVEQLTQEGWLARQIDEDLVFSRTRPQPAKTWWFPAKTINRLAILLPNMSLATGEWVQFVPGHDSRLILSTRVHVVAETSPPASREAAMGRETLDIKLEPIIGEQAEVHVQLLSPPFRNEVGVTLATLTFGGVLKWLILVAAAVAADEIKRLLVLPLRHLQRLLSRSRPRR